MSEGERPAELYVDAKWDRFIDITLRRCAYGAAGGAAAALTLFSTCPVDVPTVHDPCGSMLGHSLFQNRQNLHRVHRVSHPLLPISGKFEPFFLLSNVHFDSVTRPYTS